MARRLRISNPDLTLSEKSYLTSAYSSGTTLNVINSFAFSADNFAVIGEPGKDENIEAKRISAVPSGGLTLTIPTALDYDYPKDTTVYQSRYDQIQIESRASSSASWALISTSSIQWDKLATLYTDSNGIDTTQYRWRFYNSSTLTTSEYSPTLLGSGFTFDQAGYILREIRLLSGDLDGSVKKDREILRDMGRALEIIYGRVPKAWWWRIADATITTTASKDEYNLDTLNSGTANSPTINLGTVDLIRYQYNDGATNITYPLEFKSNLEFYDLIKDNNAQTDDNVLYYTLLDGDSSSKNGYFQVFPKPKTTGRGTFYITAYTRQPTIDSVDDSVAIPLPSILIDYGVGMIERVRGNDSKAAYYEELFFGPPPSRQERQRLTGIALLEQLNARQRHPEGHPRSLVRYIGNAKKLFGNNRVNTDYIRENYW